MPTKQKMKSMRLLTFVNNEVRNLVWDGMGRIITDDVMIPNSRIVDVIDNITISRGFKQKVPDGVKQIPEKTFFHNIFNPWRTICIEKHLSFSCIATKCIIQVTNDVVLWV